MSLLRHFWGNVWDTYVVLCIGGERRAAERSTSHCQCGCTLTNNAGHIIGSARQRCHTAIRRWTISVKPHYSIALSIDYFTLSGQSSVRVYDSDTSSTTDDTQLALLLKLTNDVEDHDGSSILVTSGHRMLIEYVTEQNDVSNDGFIASYVATNELTGIARLYTFARNQQDIHPWNYHRMSVCSRCQTLSLIDKFVTNRPQLNRLQDYGKLPNLNLKMSIKVFWRHEGKEAQYYHLCMYVGLCMYKVFHRKQPFWCIIRPRRSRSAAAYSHQTFPWTFCRSVCPSVQCIVEKRQIAAGSRSAP